MRVAQNIILFLSHIQISYAKHEMFLRVAVVVVADPLENNKLELNHATMEHTYNDFLMNIFPPLHLLSGLDIERCICVHMGDEDSPNNKILKPFMSFAVIIALCFMRTFLIFFPSYLAWCKRKINL